MGRPVWPSQSRGMAADGLQCSARIENAILCSNVRIGEKVTIKDCELGPGFEAKPGGELCALRIGRD